VLLDSNFIWRSKNTWKIIYLSSFIVLGVIGDELRKARKRAGLSQEQLAFRANLTRNYISLVELNRNSPTLDTLLGICHAAGAKAWVLVRRIEESKE